MTENYAEYNLWSTFVIKVFGAAGDRDNRVGCYGYSGLTWLPTTFYATPDTTVTWATTTIGAANSFTPSPLSVRLF